MPRASGSPPSRSSGSRPAPRARRARAPRTARTTDSASRRRATNASTCAEDRSSHCDVVDDADQRPLLRRVGQQAEHGEPDEEAIGLGAGGQAEGGLERVTLWRRQPLEAIQQPGAELMQAGEGELHLPFHPGRAKRPDGPRRLRRVLQEGRFADAGARPEAPAPRSSRAVSFAPAADRASHTRSPRGRPDSRRPPWASSP